MNKKQTNQLIRDMIEISGEYARIPSLNCHKVSRILQMATNRLNELRWNDEKYAHALNRIAEGCGCFECGGESQAEIAKEALK
jgi:hypothetical protein